MNRRRCGAAVIAALAVAGVPGIAHADPAGPTDYRSAITSITPRTDAISLSIEGGDSFVRIVAEPGAEVVVLGYDDEPYLRIAADGTVSENTRSFATYYNDTRYGTSAIPDTVDNGAEPEWRRLGSGGAWSWHDHRAHWMATDPPVGMQPGDTLPAQVIPLLVDGRRVEVEVLTTLVGGPSPVPTALGAVAGAVAGALVMRRRRGGAAPVALGGAAVALVVGGAQFLSLPAETGPRPIWWLAPAVALACATAALALRRSFLVASGLVAIAALQVLLWIGIRRSTFVRPVLPTTLPFWLDRAASAASGAAAAVALAGVTLAAAHLVRQAPRASSIAESSAS